MCARDGERGQGWLMPGAGSAHPGRCRDCGGRCFLGAALVGVGSLSPSTNPALPRAQIQPFPAPLCGSAVPRASLPREALCCGRILATPAVFSREDEAIAARGVRWCGGGCDGTPGMGTAARRQRGRGGSPNFWGWWWPSPTTCLPSRHGGAEPAFAGPWAGPTNRLLSAPQLVAHAYPVGVCGWGGNQRSRCWVAVGEQGWRQGASLPGTGRRAASWHLLPAACRYWPCRQHGPLPGRPLSCIPSSRACSIPAGCWP